MSLEAVNSKLQEESTGGAEKKVTIGGLVNDLTRLLNAERFGLQSKMAELESENAELDKKFRRSKSKHQNRIRKLKEKVDFLRQALLDQKDAHDTDDKIYDESFQSRAEKLMEELAEAEEDKAALARDNDRLAVEKASAEESLAESEDSKVAMSNDIHELRTKNDQLEQELKDASDGLEEAEDDRATLSRNVEKLTSEKARLEKELASAQDILRQISSFSSSIQPVATNSASQEANSNADADTDTATCSTGMLTPPSSVQTTPR